MSALAAAGRTDPPTLPRAAAQVAVRLATAAAGAVLLASLRIQDYRPPTLCLLRAATGIPCPLCGSTTAGVRLGRGDVAGALLANPVAVLVGTLLVLSPLITRRCHLPHRARPWLFTALAAFAWLWQIVRFDRLAL